jgi:Uma2 family endonuclease
MKKLAWYAAIGVEEYWLVDPAARTLGRLVLQGDKYLVADVVGDDAIFRPESFAGLAIPLGDLWQLPGASPST